MTKDVREIFIKHAKARVVELINAGDTRMAIFQLGNYLLRWRLCDPKTVESLCISAAIESPQDFLTQVLALQ